MFGNVPALDTLRILRDIHALTLHDHKALGVLGTAVNTNAERTALSGHGKAHAHANLDFASSDPKMAMQDASTRS